MGVPVQVTFDAASPETLGRFWATALDYVEESPPEGFDSWDAFLDSLAIPADERDTMYAVVDPDGRGPRLLFQKVPEGKTTKNRVHLDVNIGGGKAMPEGDRIARVDARAKQLVALGATELRREEQHGEYWIVLEDPEGNEFCLQ